MRFIAFPFAFAYVYEYELLVQVLHQICREITLPPPPLHVPLFQVQFHLRGLLCFEFDRWRPSDHLSNTHLY